MCLTFAVEALLLLEVEAADLVVGMMRQMVSVKKGLTEKKEKHK